MIFFTLRPFDLITTLTYVHMDNFHSCFFFIDYCNKKYLRLDFELIFQPILVIFDFKSSNAKGIPLLNLKQILESVI